MTYTLEVRKKVLNIKDKVGLSFEESAKRFRISKATLLRWSKNIEPKKTRNKKAVKVDMKGLRHDVELYPDSYHHERAKRLGVSSTCIRYAMFRLGVTFEKNSNSSKNGRRKRIYILPKDPNEKKTIHQ